MATSQLVQIPCPACQRAIQVALTQAGDFVPCSCGHQLTVPTLRELRQRAAAQAPSSPTTTVRAGWTPARGAIFVGGCVLIALAAFIYSYVQPERQRLDIRRPTVQMVDLDTVTPEQAWEGWEHFRQQKLDYRATPAYIQRRIRHRALTIYVYSCAAALGIGAILIGSSLVSASRRLQAR